MKYGWDEFDYLMMNVLIFFEKMDQGFKDYRIREARPESGIFERSFFQIIIFMFLESTQLSVNSGDSCGLT